MITEPIIMDIVGHGLGSFVVGFSLGFLFVNLKKLVDMIS